MTQQQLIQQVVEQVLQHIQGGGLQPQAEVEQQDQQLRDITSQQVKAVPLIDHVQDYDALVRMKSKTVARIGVGRAGPRLKTQALLTLRADHAAARDAVFRSVCPEFLKTMGLISYTTCCKDINQHLTRPDLGRRFDSEVLQRIAQGCKQQADVLIYASDGLSSKAIEANLANILPVIMDGLSSRGISVAQPFFVKFGRVATQDHISQATGAKVVCTLIGERPGLATAQSMSAYIAYDAHVGMEEARRTVVSNIHSGGIAAVEAGAYIAELIAKMLQAKTSGVDFKQ